MNDALVLLKSAGRLILETAGFAMSMRRTEAWPGAPRRVAERGSWPSCPVAQPHPGEARQLPESAPLSVGGASGVLQNAT